MVIKPSLEKTAQRRVVPNHSYVIAQGFLEGRQTNRRLGGRSWPRQGEADDGFTEIIAGRPPAATLNLNLDGIGSNHKHLPLIHNLLRVSTRKHLLSAKALLGMSSTTPDNVAVSTYVLGNYPRRPVKKCKASGGGIGP
jgi:hypothetical protein